MAAGGGASLSVSSIVHGLLSTSASHSAPAPSISALAASQLPNATTRCNWGAIARKASSAAAMSLVDLRKPRLVPSLSPIPRRSNWNTGKPARSNLGGEARLAVERARAYFVAPADDQQPGGTRRAVERRTAALLAAFEAEMQAAHRSAIPPLRSQPAHRPAWHRNRFPHAATEAARRHRPDRRRRA